MLALVLLLSAVDGAAAADDGAPCCDDRPCDRPTARGWLPLLLRLLRLLLVGWLQRLLPFSDALISAANDFHFAMKSDLEYRAQRELADIDDLFTVGFGVRWRWA